MAISSELAFSFLLEQEHTYVNLKVLFLKSRIMLSNEEIEALDNDGKLLYINSLHEALQEHQVVLRASSKLVSLVLAGALALMTVTFAILCVVVIEWALEFL